MELVYRFYQAVLPWLLFKHELYAKKWANTLVTEWDPCDDSVLAIGEQVGHSSQAL